MFVFGKLFKTFCWLRLKAVLYFQKDMRNNTGTQLSSTRNYLRGILVNYSKKKKRLRTFRSQKRRTFKNCLPQKNQGVQLQCARGNLLKRCSEDIWDISKKTSLWSSNLHKTTSQLFKSHFICLGFPGNSRNISKSHFQKNIKIAIIILTTLIKL